jgi:hypothetical protein
MSSIDVPKNIVSRMNWMSRGACALTLALLLVVGARAQQPDQQAPAQQDQAQQDQAQQQSPPPPAQTQVQPPADQPPPPPAGSADARPKPKYAPQDENRPPYSNDHPNQNQGDGNGPGAQAPSPDQYDPNQDLGPEDGPAQDQNPNGPANGYPNGRPQNAPPPRPRQSRPLPPPPAALTIPAGTVISVRVNEFLSSDRNQVGDRVTATLQQPLVVNGYVVARRGQTLVGQVEAAQKAGRVKGTSQLGIELTDITLVDGQQRPILTELWKGSGGTSHGQDAATIGGTTALGAIIGSAADWGRGAAIGAGAGAAAGIGAVLLTRGRPTVIAPETPLSFRLVDPVTVDTTQSQQAFLPVDQQDYDGRGQRRPRLAGNYPPPYGASPYGPAPYACGDDAPCYAYPSYGYPGYAYPGYAYPGYFYPGIGFYGGYGFGPRFYGGFGRGGFRR